MLKKSVTRALRRALLSGAAAVSVIGLANVLKSLPYSVLRDTVTDAILFPGAIIARIPYPAGVHTGWGSAKWGDLALLGNLAFYALLCFVILHLVARGRAARGSADDRERTSVSDR